MCSGHLPQLVLRICRAFLEEMVRCWQLVRLLWLGLWIIQSKVLKGLNGEAEREANQETAAEIITIRIQEKVIGLFEVTTERPPL